MASELVIFDCDGVLVDSEAIALDVMRATLADLGLALDAWTVRRRFLGRSLASTVADLARDGIDFDADRQDAMGQELRRRFDADLRAIDGMDALIDALAVPCCVASSSQTGRLQRSLRTTGLLDRFDGAVFSADEVERGKPAPDLFLHAARRMGVAPERCIVVEDSLPGLEAARAAGMRAVVFAGGSHLTDPVARAPLAGHGAIVRDAASLARYLPTSPEGLARLAEASGAT